MLKQILKRLADHPVQTQLAEGGGNIYAAVLLPLVNDPEQPSIVLTKRSENLSSHSGQVAFPGGKWDHTDASLLTTALRETHEEINLHPGNVEVLAELPPLHTLQNTYVLPYVGLVSPEVEYLPNPGELDAVFKVPVSYLADPKNLSTFVYNDGSGAHKMPCFHFEGFVIWGFTLNILAGFLNYTLDTKLQLNYPPAIVERRAGKMPYEVVR